VILRVFTGIFLVTYAHAAKAILRTGREYNIYIIPMLAVAIDLSRRNQEMVSDTTIKRKAPHLSIFEARLKKNHHKKIPTESNIPPRTPTMVALGIRTGRRYLIEIKTTEKSMPGHSLRGSIKSEALFLFMIVEDLFFISLVYWSLTFVKDKWSTLFQDLFRYQFYHWCPVKVCLKIYNVFIYNIIQRLR